MSAIDNARGWFFNIAVPLKNKEAGKRDTVYASLSYYPQRAQEGPIVAINDTPDLVWQNIEYTLANQAGLGRSFVIKVGSGPTDGKQSPWVVDMSPMGVGLPQYQVGGLGAYGAPAPAVNIGEIESRLEAKYKNEMEQLLKFKALEDQVAGLSYELKTKKRNSENWIDKIEGFAESTGLDLSNPQSIKEISGLLMGVVDKVLGAFKPTAVGPAPVVAGRGTKIEEHEATGSVPPLEDDDDDDDNVLELDQDQEQALSAVEVLRGAGCNNPGELILKVAQFYAKDPAKARGFINFL